MTGKHIKRQGVSLIERALVEREWHQTAIEAQIHALMGDSSHGMVNAAGRVLYVLLGAAAAEAVDPEQPEIVSILAAVEAVHDQVGEEEISPGRRETIVAGLAAAEVADSCIRAPQPRERGHRPQAEDAPAAHPLQRFRRAVQTRSCSVIHVVIPPEYIVPHEQMLAGYAVACRFGIYESRALDLAEAMWRAFQAAQPEALKFPEIDSSLLPLPKDSAP